MTASTTYALSDFLLFTPRTYYRLFELYNREIWPLQVPALVLGIVILVFVFRRTPWTGRLAAAVLAASWLWIAWAYHWQRYAAINWAAPWFAASFALEALLLIWEGLVRNRFFTRPAPTIIRRAGVGLSGFALLVYPFVNPLLGHDWTQAELFGIAPDPTVMVTLGILMMAKERQWWGLMVIPALWCAVSGATLWAMGAPYALVPPLTAAMAVLILATFRKR